MLELPNQNCNLCGYPLDYIKIHDYWKCSNPECWIEIWYNEPERRRKVTSAEARAVLRSDTAYKNQLISKRTGSRPAGRKRKKPPEPFPPGWIR